MIGVIRAVRYIRGNKIASSPNLYKSIVLSDNQFSSEYDESDDIEFEKKIVYKDRDSRGKETQDNRWGDTTINME